MHLITLLPLLFIYLIMTYSSCNYRTYIQATGMMVHVPTSAHYSWSCSLASISTAIIPFFLSRLVTCLLLGRTVCYLRINIIILQGTGSKKITFLPQISRQ